jgi:phage tail protein X
LEAALQVLFRRHQMARTTASVSVVMTAAPGLAHLNRRKRKTSKTAPLIC